MFKGGFCQAQKNHIRAHLPEGNKIPAKSRSPITRSPTKAALSPYSRSPIRKQSKRPSSPAYNPPYVKINYINVKSPNKEKTPLKEIKDKYNTNTDQANKFRDQSKFSPYGIVLADHMQRQDSDKCIQNRKFKLKNYNFFNKAAIENVKQPKKGSNCKQNVQNNSSNKHHPLISHIQDIKFITVNYFNSDPNLNKINKVKKQNIQNQYHQMHKPVQKLIQKQLNNDQSQKQKHAVVKQSYAYNDMVIMSFDPQFEDPYSKQLTMDPFL